MKTNSYKVGFPAFLLFILLIFSGGSRGEASDQKFQQKNRSDSKGWIGVIVQDVTGKIANKVKLDSEEGAYVRDVVDESPADSAGIQEGDVIIEYQNKKIIDADDLANAVRKTSPGTTVKLLYVRDGEKHTASFAVGKAKRSKTPVHGMLPHIPDVRVFMNDHILGLRLLTLNDQLGEYFGVPNNEGVLVEEVDKESAGEQAGFKAGDVIIRVGKKKVDAVERVERELRKFEEGDKVEIEVMRKGVNKTLQVEVEEDQSQQDNFFFDQPHLRMFRMNPFDNFDMQLELDSPQRHWEHKQLKQDQAGKDIKIEAFRHKDVT